MINQDFMQIALEQARKAERRGEVPIGAVIVQNGKIIAKAFNMRERGQNALAHAEVIAISKACKRLKSWRLDNCTMYVTLEPCMMCMGAIINARIKKVVCGAKSDSDLNHRVEVEFVLHEECRNILKNFFASKR